jgi:hypothetical protein
MSDVLTKRPPGFYYKGITPPWEPVEDDDDADYVYMEPTSRMPVPQRAPRVSHPELDDHGQWYLMALACQRHKVMRRDIEVSFVADMIRQNERRLRSMSINQAQWLAALHQRIDKTMKE